MLGRKDGKKSKITTLLPAPVPCGRKADPALGSVDVYCWPEHESTLFSDKHRVPATREDGT